MTQFETDMVYLNEEVTNISKSSVFSYPLPFSQLHAALERGGSLLYCSNFRFPILSASSEATSQQVAVVQRPPPHGLHPAHPPPLQLAWRRVLARLDCAVSGGRGLINSFIRHRLV